MAPLGLPSPGGPPASPLQPAAKASRITAAPRRRNVLTKSPRGTQLAPGYLPGAGVAGVAGGGAVGAGVPGAAGAGVAGAVVGAGSRTTEPVRSPPSRARLNDVMVKRIAITAVILPTTVGVPIEPNTAWLPAPPNAEPMSAPLPDCKNSTMAMMAKHMSPWRTVSAMTI